MTEAEQDVASKVLDAAITLTDEARSWLVATLNKREWERNSEAFFDLCRDFNGNRFDRIADPLLHCQDTT